MCPAARAASGKHAPLHAVERPDRGIDALPRREQFARVAQPRMQSCCVPSSAAAPSPTSQNAPKAVQPVTTAGRMSPGAALPQKMIHCQLLRSSAARTQFRSSGVISVTHAQTGRPTQRKIAISRVRPSAMPSRRLQPWDAAPAQLEVNDQIMRFHHSGRPAPSESFLLHRPFQFTACISWRTAAHRFRQIVLHQTPLHQLYHACRRARFGAARE